jgi:predicted CXXCH cytochrome family protein
MWDTSRIWLRRAVPGYILTQIMTNSAHYERRIWLSTALSLVLLSTAAFSQSSQDCLACHSNPTLNMNKGGQTVALFVDEASLKESIHAALPCVSCHIGLSAGEIPHAKAIKPVNCVNCHETPDFEGSIHRVIAECKSCHGSHDMRSAKDPRSAVGRINVSGVCGKCHDEALTQFSASAHGGVPGDGKIRTPSCVTCHGAHNIVPGVNKKSQAGLCLKCHLDDPEIQKQVGYSASFIAGYKKSIHAVALESGNQKSATCSDCHGSHDLKKAGDPASSVNKKNIAQTCSPCHSEAAGLYAESIHGTALQKGKDDSPTCTDCHGEHEIYARSDKRSPVAPGNVSVQVCGTCHNSVQLNQKYGLPSQQFNSFRDSYHGLAARAGALKVANCASCHGVHNIKPSSDPTSRVNKANLAATCGRCHPGAGRNFARGAVHVVIGRDSNSNILYWIRAIYIILIIVTVGFMILHNLLDFIQKTRRRLAVRQGRVVPEHAGSARYTRMTLNARLQHATTLVSFVILAATGFMLRYPEAWWVIPFRHMSEEFFAIRGLLHRIAGAMLIAVGIWHLFYLFTRAGRRFYRDIVGKPGDVIDLWNNLRYLVGRSAQRPRFDRFGYAEKAEYWALIWGVVIMGATGIVMWFDNYFINLFTKLGWDISRTIHFYEACLAALAIVVWHLYFVILNPDVYPMNMAWITGKISEQEMEEEHPLELERLRLEQGSRKGNESGDPSR